MIPESRAHISSFIFLTLTHNCLLYHSRQVESIVRAEGEGGFHLEMGDLVELERQSLSVIMGMGEDSSHCRCTEI